MVRRSSRRPVAQVLPELGTRLNMALMAGHGPAAERAPYVRRAANVDSLLLCFVLASVPAWLVGLWNLGYLTLHVLAHNEGAAMLGWQGALFSNLAHEFPQGFAPQNAGTLACLVLGLLYQLPLLITVLLVTLAWEVLFASRRGRRIDAAWMMTPWLFVLLLPAAVSPLLAGVAVSFGVVLGSHIFGGTGRYLVSPALLGILFLHFSYPGFEQAALPLIEFSGATTWSLVATQGANSGLGFAAALLGKELGAIGTGSALACIVGAAYLVYAGAASGRVLAGAVLGLLIGASLAGLFAGADPAWGVAWYWHLVVGNFAFGVAFLATDPSVGPLTRPARWGYGALIGLLTVVIRVVDPSHPEGSLYAILLAGLTVPLLDYVVVRRYRRRAAPEEVK